ncbi:uncharacterized protein LOC104908456 [Beta vulgaris subsp. vulgaris]|uniref:uncharacterized protein LOC104908456 n=1 Tax=Beta vulgaris subsp. vulgaris TaxID=3555 RepID=UPI00203690F3|nr:uncharacterized protein LOC104908456 [Beta vulgaris subsp. vulgaris]
MNEDVDAINMNLIGKFPGEPIVYKSFDMILDDSCNMYPSEFLNTLSPAGMSPHELILKENCPVILLQNLAPASGLCNGTRLIFAWCLEIIKINDNQIEGKKPFIGRMKPEKTYLDKLTPTTKAYKVKVKLKEKSRTLISPHKKTRYQQLIFEDEKGNTMRGALFENQIDEFENVFKHEHDVPPAYIPIDAIPHTNDQDDRFDVLGIVLFVEDTHTITTTYGVQHQVREIIVTDHSSEQPLTILAWDDLTGHECELLKSWAGPSLIVGFTSLKPSNHKGFSLSTSMATMFNRNPPGERADALRKWAAEKREVVADRLARVVVVRNVPDHIAILTLEEIKKKKPENTLQEEKCWVRVIIPEPDRSRIVILAVTTVANALNQNAVNPSLASSVEKKSASQYQGSHSSSMLVMIQMK